MADVPNSITKAYETVRAAPTPEAWAYLRRVLMGELGRVNKQLNGGGGKAMPIDNPAQGR